MARAWTVGLGGDEEAKAFLERWPVKPATPTP